MKITPYRRSDLTPKAPLALSLALTMLLPLSAAAIDSDTKNNATKTATAASQDTKKTAPQTKNGPAVTENNADKLDNLKADTAAKPLISDTSEPLANNSQITNRDLSSSSNLQETATNSAPSTDSIATPQATPAAAQAPKKTIFGLSLDYMLAGIIALLVLGLGFLLSQLRALADENKKLTQNLSKLAAQVNSNNKSLKQLKEENLKIRQELHQISIAQSSKSYEPNQLNNNAVLPLPIDDKPVISDLDLADRKQLADILNKWLTTNRGKNKIEEVIPAKIQQKINHWHYSIQFWAQGDGVDDVKPTKNQMYVSVISLTRPDQQGIAYCYNKPNSLSTLWKNQSWYEVQYIGQTLNVSGTPLETV